MNRLKIFERTDHVQAVSAKELYKALGMDKSNWASWYKVNITGSRFAMENQDYTVFVEGTKTLKNGRPTIDFAITIDFAKRLCMLARTERGEEIRNYFIECEKRLYGKRVCSPVSTRSSPKDDYILKLEKRIIRLEKTLNAYIYKQSQPSLRCTDFPNLKTGDSIKIKGKNYRAMVIN